MITSMLLRANKLTEKQEAYSSGRIFTILLLHCHKCGYINITSSTAMRGIFHNNIGYQISQSDCKIYTIAKVDSGRRALFYFCLLKNTPQDLH